MSCRRQVFVEKQAAAEAAAARILEMLGEATAERGQATLAVSGGSTPKLMFQKMAEAEFDWRDVHVFWVDERCVPSEHDDSNYKMIREALLEPAGIASGQIHRIHGELPPKQGAIRYESEIQEFFDLAGGEFPRFDVVHLGMGGDAHTASLFPGEPRIEDRENVAAAVYSESRKSHRVTLLPGALLNARNTLFLVTGEDKAEPLREVVEGAFDPLRLPAQLFARESNNLEWFLDEAAAGNLSRS